LLADRQNRWYNARAVFWRFFVARTLAAKATLVSVICSAARAPISNAEILGVPMNKTDIVHSVAKQADISKVAAAQAVDAFIDAVKGALMQGDSVALIGFGTFAVRNRAARTGINPKTKKPLKIKAAKVPAFRPGKALKDAVN
jgi:DNA-binding protein HU-beta